MDSRGKPQIEKTTSRGEEKSTMSKIWYKMGKNRAANAQA